MRCCKLKRLAGVISKKPKKEREEIKTKILYSIQCFCLFPWEPFHRNGHGWGVGEGRAKPKHEAIGNGCGKEAVLDGEVGEEDSAGHEGRPKQNGHSHTNAFLQVS